MENGNEEYIKLVSDIKPEHKLAIVQWANSRNTDINNDMIFLMAFYNTMDKQCQDTIDKFYSLLDHYKISIEEIHRQFRTLPDAFIEEISNRLPALVNEKIAYSTELVSNEVDRYVNLTRAHHDNVSMALGIVVQQMARLEQHPAKLDVWLEGALKKIQEQGNKQNIEKAIFDIQQQAIEMLTSEKSLEAIKKHINATSGEIVKIQNQFRALQAEIQKSNQIQANEIARLIDLKLSTRNAEGRDLADDFMSQGIKKLKESGMSHSARIGALCGIGAYGFVWILAQIFK